MTPKDLIIWATRRAKTTHNAFLRNPNSNNWRDTVQAMLVYQQAEWLLRSRQTDIGTFLIALVAADPERWPEMICEEAGCSLSDAMQ